DERVMERINALRTQRETALRDNELRYTSIDRKDVEERREHELEEARRAESDTLAQLREHMGGVSEEDIFFAPTDHVIVKVGDVVSPKHLDSLERMAETARNAIAEAARREIEAAQSEGKREADRLGIEYQGQIDTAQSQIEKERNETRQRLEQLRRDLQGLKKMDLLQENRCRELRDSFPGVFRAGMGAEAVRELIADISLDKLSADLRHEISATVGQRRKKATKRLKVVEAFRKSHT